MLSETFEYILGGIAPLSGKTTDNWKRSKEVKERLVIILR
jgi:hypothetical protein